MSGISFTSCIVVLALCANSFLVNGAYVENATGSFYNDYSENSDIGYSPNARSYRKSKFFPLFTIVRFTNEACQATPEDGGICTTRKQCKLKGGSSQGTCAQGLGVCCQFQSTCGAIITQNGTLFRNPNYPSKYTPPGGSDVCQVRIRKPLNICQLRLNFHKFDIEGPVTVSNTATGLAQASQDAGSCKMDALTITSSGAIVPQLCGTLTGQHLYVDFGTSETITMNLMMSGNIQRDREWSIEVVTIPCNSVSRAPVGCLQYFTGVSGQVESFNNPGPHLQNQDYSICVRMEDGMRSIEWTGCTAQSVKISGPSTPLATPPGTAPICPSVTTGTGQGSPSDYLIIMGGIQYPQQNIQTGTTPAAPVSNSDRYCDASFANPSTNSVRTSARPFIVHFKTDGLELANTNDASGGFCLKWQQSPQPI